jgi:hypothetical protein
MHSEPLKQGVDQDGRTVFEFPRLDQKAITDPSWSSTLDTLREPRKSNQNIADWRKESPIRPVIFEDAGVLTDELVQLHLEQRVAQRLLARFRSQGFVHHDLSRACLGQSADSIPRVVLLARLSLFGQSAERLHEELVPITARWIEPSLRKEPLKPYAADTESKTLELLDDTLRKGKLGHIPEPIQKKLLVTAETDIEQLLVQLTQRAEETAEEAKKKLAARGEKEALDLVTTLKTQQTRVRERLAKFERDPRQFEMDFGDGSGFSEDELRQLKADARAWTLRLQQFEKDLKTEPERIKNFYQVRATRIEPVGLVYLWPESN